NGKFGTSIHPIAQIEDTRPRSRQLTVPPKRGTAMVLSRPEGSPEVHDRFCRLDVILLSAAVLAIACSARILAQDRPPEKIGEAKERAEDAQAIRKASAAFAENFAKRDAKAIAAACTTNCEYYDEHSGDAFRGQRAIEKAFSNLFVHMPQARITADI